MIEQMFPLIHQPDQNTSNYFDYICEMYVEHIRASMRNLHLHLQGESYIRLQIGREVSYVMTDSPWLHIERTESSPICVGGTPTEQPNVSITSSD